MNERTEPSALALRLLRIGASLINVAPSIAPAFPFAFAVAAGEGHGWGGEGLFFVFGLWCLSSSALVLLVNAVSLVRRRQSMGLSYCGLIAECPRPGRLLLAEAALLLLPLLLGAVASRYSDDSETSTAILLYTPGVCWLANWVSWLGPAQRTLADRLAGCRVQALLRPAGALAELHRQRPSWPDALLLGPFVLWLPWYARLHGAAVGGALGAVVLAVPIVLTRRRK